MDYTYIIALSLARGIGNKTAKLLLRKYKKAEYIFESSAKDLSQFINLKKAEDFLKNKNLYLQKAKLILEKAAKKKISIISIEENVYPKILKEIPDPPTVLYLKGSLDVKENNISVVGSRKYSSYGKSVTEKFVTELVSEGITIVSGMALGIDSIAHKTTLKHDGYTIAVLGSGVDIIYPFENKKLYYEILEKGAVISEYPPGIEPSKYTFPQRNRIIAGLSHGTIITEASRKSGALITAKLANDYGRIVFSVPANINNPYAEGNNLLIKEGAIPLTDIEDIKENIPFIFSSKEKTNKDIQLTEVESKILELLVEPKHIDNLIDKIGLSFSEISVVLFDLELKGVIENQNGLYIKK